jgi:uncharacterized membrane protein
MTGRRGPTVTGLGNRIAPPRFLGFLILLPLAYFGYRHWLGATGWRDAFAMAFDAAACCFLASLVPLLRDSRVDDIRRHAAGNDANRFIVLIVTTLMALAAMASISGELDASRNGEPAAAGKLVATLLLVWLFANAVYGLHYAHFFYARDPEHGGDTGGLIFPGMKTPGYADFAYFSFTLGMTFQTSDVTIASAALRRVALLHGFVAFVFNIGVIAFTINVLGGS